MDKKSPSATLPADPAELDGFIDAAAGLNGLVIDPAYRAGVRIHLHAVTNAAKLVVPFTLEDDSEPAPVFRP